MTGATEELNYRDEKENKRGAQDGEGEKREKRPNVPPGRRLHKLLRSSKRIERPVKCFGVGVVPSEAFVDLTLRYYPAGLSTHKGYNAPF